MARSLTVTVTGDTVAKTSMLDIFNQVGIVSSRLACGQALTCRFLVATLHLMLVQLKMQKSS